MFKLTENQEMLLRVFGEFLEQEIKPKIKELNTVDEFPFWVRDRMLELGYTKIGLPEEYGGFGESLTTRLLLLEEGCKVHHLVGHLADMSANGLKLLSVANKEQIETYLPRIIDDGELFGMAFTEASAGSDSRGIQTTAVLDGDEWVLNGTKVLISYIGAVGVWQLSAQTKDENGKEGISAFLVDDKTPGLEHGAHYKKFGFIGSCLGDLHFRNCRIPKSALLGEINKGLKVNLGLLDASRLCSATKALGFAEGAFEKALEYAKQREQFGKRICDFESIQNYLADSKTSIEAGRAFIYSLAKQKEAGMSISNAASMAKLYCAEMAKEVCDKAIQICGGMGLVTDFGIESFFRNARVISISEGTNEIQRMIIARELIKK
jgi:alkylation response protein AidB-like acyl-CoA dehydrogenase